MTRWGTPGPANCPLELARLLAEIGKATFRASGTCMYPWVRPGDLLHVEPRTARQIAVGEIISEFFNTTLEIRRFEKNYFLYRQESDYSENIGYVKKAIEMLEGSAAGFDLLANPLQVARLRQVADELADLSDLRWHFIGHLQSNKARRAVELFDMIHSVDSLKLAERLNAQGLPGVRFAPAAFTPAAITGMSSRPKFKDRRVAGVRTEIVDQSAVLPVETGVAVLAALYASLPAPEKSAFFREGFARMAGTDRLQRSLELRHSAEEIQSLWQAEVETFRKAREPYLIYGR